MKRTEEKYVYGTVGCDYWEMEPDLSVVVDAFTEDLSKAWDSFEKICKHADTDEVFFLVCVKQTIEIEDGCEDRIIDEEIDELIDDFGIDHSTPHEWDD